MRLQRSDPLLKFDSNGLPIHGAIAGALPWELVADPAVFAVSAPGRRIELEFREGYSHAQVYSPAGERFICLKPMTAPSNALISRAALPVVAPGESYAAAFTMTVRDYR